ncbi:MAG: YecA family protein [Rubrivivax sp.]|jgi:uncharacterized protein|nr:YecA family protein [Rubrivivax sp.]
MNALTDDDIARLQSLLDGLPAPLQPLDTSAVDGFLCGVLLQPRPVPLARWLPAIYDLDGRAPPPGAQTDEIRALVERRHAEIDAAIGRRDWFDPWIYPLEAEDGEPAAPSECLLPWIAGFAAATDFFPELMAVDDPALVEPLALLFMHIDPDDLEDADALAAVIETLEPPSDLAEAVQDTVRALMLIADVTRPRAAPPKTKPPQRRHSASTTRRTTPRTHRSPR